MLRLTPANGCLAAAELTVAAKKDPTANLDAAFFFLVFIGGWQTTNWCITASNWYGVGTGMSLKY